MIDYKGYVGVVEYDSDARAFVGRVVNTRDVIGFRGTSVEELEASLHDAVETYIEMLDERGEEPRLLKGEFMVRMDPSLHGMLLIASSRADESLNGYVVRVLRENLAARAAAFGGLLLGDDFGQPLGDARAAPSGARKHRKPKRRTQAHAHAEAVAGRARPA